MLGLCKHIIGIKAKEQIALRIFYTSICSRTSAPIFFMLCNFECWVTLFTSSQYQ
jgi:hypothetical protein